MGGDKIKNKKKCKKIPSNINPECDDMLHVSFVRLSPKIIDFGAKTPNILLSQEKYSIFYIKSVIRAHC